MITRRGFFGAAGPFLAQQPFSIFTGAPNRLDAPTVSQGNVSNRPTTPVQAQTQRQSLYYSGFVEPYIQPQIDGTFEWPLRPTIQQTTKVGAVSLWVLVQTAPGNHAVCSRLHIVPINNTSAAIVRFWITPDLANLSNAMLIATLGGQGDLPTGITDPGLPIIGGVTYYTPTAASTNLIMMKGMRPVYIPEGYSLVMTDSPGIMDTSFWVESITAPSTVPLSSLLSGGF